MAMARVTIIYYSSTGTNHAMAQAVEAGAAAAGAEVRRRIVAETAPDAAIDSNPKWRAFVDSVKNEPRATVDDFAWGDAVIFGTPTRFGNVASQLKQFIDTLGPAWSRGLLAGKVYSGFTSTKSPHGGNESTLLALANSFYHFGGIIVPPGYTHPDKFADGNPYGTAHTCGTDAAAVNETTRNAARVQAARVVRFARAVKTA